MEKFIELLNERIKEWWKPYWDDYSITKIDEIWKSDWLCFVSFVWEGYPWPVNLEHLLTKQAGLIKWLVDNDKIDREWMKWHWRLISYCLYIKSWEWDKIKEGVLLMLLAIQDSPLEFLISILK